jgi:hypothetical protein
VIASVPLPLATCTTLAIGKLSLQVAAERLVPIDWSGIPISMS